MTSFRLNGTDYDTASLPAEGQRLVALLNQAQTEQTRLQGQLVLMQAAQQHLLEQLKPLLAAPPPAATASGPTVLGEASATIPTTPVQQPEQVPAALPTDMPDAIRAR